MSSPLNQPWYNGDPPPLLDYVSIASEGGCLCSNSYTEGYFSFPHFCQICIDGMGPNTMTEWAAILQSNSLVSQVLPNRVPFNVIAFNYTYFKENVICRFPISSDPIVSSLAEPNICGGHGLLSTSDQVAVTSTLLLSENFFPTCMAIQLGEGETFSLSDKTTTLHALIYLSQRSSLYILGDESRYAVYVNETLCSLSCLTPPTYPIPFQCEMDCPSLFSTTILCQNEVLLGRRSTNVTMLYMKNFFLSTNLTASYFN